MSDEFVQQVQDTVRTLDDEHLAETMAAVLGETRRRERKERARQDADRAAQDYAEAVEDEPPTEYEDGQVVGPGEKVIEGGTEFVNNSGAWLSVGPADYPLGYERTETPEDVAPFQPDEQVEPGDLREYEGTVYEVLQAHTTAAHWSPDAAHSLWTKA